MDSSSRSYIRRRCRIIVCFSLINCIFITHMLVSRGVFTNNNNSSEMKTSMTRSIKSQYDYYFRIEYTIVDSPCQPIQTFQTVETIGSVEQITNDKINDIISKNVTVDLQILKVNATLQSLKRFDSNILFLKRSEIICNYILELFTGVTFPPNCNINCQAVQLQRITTKMNSFDYSSDPIMTFIPSKDSSIRHSIHNIFIHQTIKFYPQTVFIKSLIGDYHFTVSTCDSNMLQPYLLMSSKIRSLFILRKGLDLSDASSIYISFASWSQPNHYLRHENGKLKIAGNDHSILFRQDATFKVIYDQKQENVAFQAINVGNNHLLYFDLKNNASLFLSRYDKPMIMSELDQAFLFKIIPFN